MSYATRRALYGKLAGDNTLTALLHSPPTGWNQSIYFEQAPSGAGFPYLIFSKQSGTPSYGMSTAGTAAVIDDEIWLIKGVDHSESSDTVETIQARLNALLTDANLSISGKTQLYLRRESDTDYAELVDGEEYKHSGSLFRLAVV